MTPATDPFLQDASVTLTCSFDCNYLEPALVTLKTLLPYKKLVKKIYLLFLPPSDPDSARVLQARRVLSNAVQAFKLGEKLEVLEVNNRLPDFKVHHFSNAILFKALVPEALPNESLILNIDAGCIIGGGFPDFLTGMLSAAKDNTRWSVGAFLSPADGMLPQNLPKGSSFYPNAQLLLFHTPRYQSSRVSERLSEGYVSYSQQLELAEQELLSLILSDSEFLSFPFSEEIYLDDLATFVYSQPQEIDSERLRTCIYYKNTGGCKPWKIWNLNPNKRIYLEHRSEIESILDPDSNRFIQENRISAYDNDVLTVNLLAFERSLIPQSFAKRDNPASDTAPS